MKIFIKIRFLFRGFELAISRKHFRPKLCKTNCATDQKIDCRQNIFQPHKNQIHDMVAPTYLIPGFSCWTRKNESIGFGNEIIAKMVRFLPRKQDIYFDFLKIFQIFKAGFLHFFQNIYIKRKRAVLLVQF